MNQKSKRQGHGPAHTHLQWERKEKVLDTDTQQPAEQKRILALNLGCYILRMGHLLSQTGICFPFAYLLCCVCSNHTVLPCQAFCLCLSLERKALLLRGRFILFQKKQESS